MVKTISGLVAKEEQRKYIQIFVIDMIFTGSSNLEVAIGSGWIHKHRPFNV